MLGIKRTAGTSGIPVWQGLTKDIQLVQGGFKLTETGLADDVILPAGSPVVYDEAARTATVLHVAEFYEDAGAAATVYKVAKFGNSLKVGDYLASGATGGKAYAITAIDKTTSTLYDSVTVGTTIGAVTAGDTAYASTATGATSSALPAANGLLYEDTVIKSGFIQSISVVIRGTVYARRVPYSAAIAALFDDIIYSQSK